MIVVSVEVERESGVEGPGDVERQYSVVGLRRELTG